MTEIRVLDKFRTFRIQNWLFDVISYSFGIIFGQKTQEIFGQKTEEHVKTIKQSRLEAKKRIFAEKCIWKKKS